jgi:MATE family multidrug resistance protein
MKKNTYQLTPYPIGSIREVLSISWPLMIGLLAGSLMIFTDRLMLSHFSLDAMTSSATAGTGVYAFLILPMTIVSITQVFVGQYHGSGEFSKIGVFVWQMIWFALFLTPVFIMMSIFISPILFPSDPLAKQYFSIIIFFGSFLCLPLALTGFFAGQGKVKIITMVTITGNCINAVANYALIFGKGPFPMMGIKGAAIGTIFSQFLMFVIYFIIFFSAKNRKTKGTNKITINPFYFLQCLKVGFPASIAHFSEFLAHFVYFIIIAKTSKEYLVIITLIQSIYILLFFIIEGISKGVTAICSNYIGSHHFAFVGKNLKASFKLLSIFTGIIIIIFIICSPNIFYIFLNNNSELMNSAEFMSNLYKTSIYLSFMLLFDGWSWILIGMLTSAGDTKFIMKIGSILPWALFIPPVYLIAKVFKLSVDKVWLWLIVYVLITFFIYLWRFKSNKWQKIDLKKV